MKHAIKVASLSFVISLNCVCLAASEESPSFRTSPVLDETDLGAQTWVPPSRWSAPEPKRQPQVDRPAVRENWQAPQAEERTTVSVDSYREDDPDRMRPGWYFAAALQPRRQQSWLDFFRHRSGIIGSLLRLSQSMAPASEANAQLEAIKEMERSGRRHSDHKILADLIKEGDLDKIKAFAETLQALSPERDRAYKYIARDAIKKGDDDEIEFALSRMNIRKRNYRKNTGFTTSPYEKVANETVDHYIATNNMDALRKVRPLLKDSQSAHRRASFALIDHYTKIGDVEQLIELRFVHRSSRFFLFRSEEAKRIDEALEKIKQNPGRKTVEEEL